MRKTILLALLTLAACQDEVPPEQQEAEAQKDVAVVKAANNILPPVEQVEPIPLTAADIQRYDLLGKIGRASCRERVYGTV